MAAEIVNNKFFHKIIEDYFMYKEGREELEYLRLIAANYSM